MPMDTINDRMELIVNEQFKGNKAAFAKTIGLPPTGLSNYLGNKRRSKPSVDMIAKIVTELNVDAKWLLTGIENNQADNVSVGDISANNIAIGKHSSVSISGEPSYLQERIKHLEELLAEKERLINVLMEGRK